MAYDVHSLLSRVCDLISEQIDADRIAVAKRRQAGVMAGREVDYIPMLFQCPCATDDKEQFPDFDWAEQWHDPAKSLYTQLRDILGSIASGCDYVPGVRADTGVINCMTIFGAKYTVPKHTKPIVTEYVSKDVLSSFEVPKDISGFGVMPRMAEHMQHHMAVLRAHGLGDLISVHHCDQQGPFDIAAQARGHDIFIDLYEDGDFAHALMTKCTQVYVAVSKLCKRISGELPDACNASGVWMENGSVRMCGDSDILISAEQHKEFVQPYQSKAFQQLGGGWLHYCGGWPDTGRMEGLHLHELYGQEEGLRGLNWTTAGDWVGEMRKLKALNVVHLGGVPRIKDETLEDYFRRVLSLYDCRGGIIFQFPDLKPEELDTAMAVWHKVQDEIFVRGE